MLSPLLESPVEGEKLPFAMLAELLEQSAGSQEPTLYQPPELQVDEIVP